jgi:hypothetical protein
LWSECVFDFSRYQRSAAANALGIDVRVVFGYARACHGADYPAGRAACDCACNGTGSGGGKPSGGHDRSNARDCHQTKTREQATSAADGGTYASTCASALGCI